MMGAWGLSIIASQIGDHHMHAIETDDKTSMESIYNGEHYLYRGVSQCQDLALVY